MNRRFAILTCAALLTGCAAAPVRAPVTTSTTRAAPSSTMVTQPTTNGSLAARIDAFIAQPRFAHADWGIDVRSLDSGKTLYTHHADKLFVPASNAKLYIAALALDTLGADARITTSLYATTAAAAAGILDGDLILYGRGDPSLGDSQISPDWAERFATALATHGVRRVRGDLIADDTFFAGTPIGNGWEANDLQTWYAAPASALSVDENLIHVRVSRDGARCCDVAVDPSASAMQIVDLTHNTTDNDNDTLGIYRPPGSSRLYVYGGLPDGVRTKTYALSTPEPALLAGNQLRDALTRHSIMLDGRVRALHWPRTDAALSRRGIVTIAEITSPPLSNLIRQMLKHSDNLYAQDLLEHVGVKSSQRGVCADRAQPPHNSADWGLCALRALLTRAGIADELVTFEEGTGLSRKDLVSPIATSTLLAWLAHQPFAAQLRDALPVAGVDGTLQHRMLGTAAANNLRAKTGTLSHAYALSGYVTDASGEHLVFSLMLDHYQRLTDGFDRNVAPSPDDDLDTIAAMLAENAQ